MKADTFAKLVVLEALIEAEIGYFLEFGPPSLEHFREGMIARISDLVDEVDVLDSAVAARVYDAIVDFLAELPEDHEGVVEATVRFRRAIDRITERGIDGRDLRAASTWAVVLDELLSELADEYHAAVLPDGEILLREFLRAQLLLTRAHMAAHRMLIDANPARPDILSEMDRLTFAVRHRRLRPTAVDFVIQSLQREAGGYRPSTLTRIGAFVLRQVLRRERGRRTGEKTRPTGGTRFETDEPRRAG